LTEQEDGIWARITLIDDSRVHGFAAGADTPNDFWLKFRTQLVQLQHVRTTAADGAEAEFDRLYVNRDHIKTVEVVEA
jgi:hypothetical protein